MSALARVAWFVVPAVVVVAAGWWVGHAFASVLAGMPR